VDPEDALAPVMPPVTVPIVHTKLLAALAERLIFGDVPLQVVTVDGVVTTGFGFTVTVIVYGVPIQDPVVAVGVTIYWTVPGVVLLELVSV